MERSLAILEITLNDDCLRVFMRVFCVLMRAEARRCLFVCLRSRFVAHIADRH